MPHVTIKHFPNLLSDSKAQTLSEALTAAVTTAFDCPDVVVSIALEPVPPACWDEQVYQPEIAGRRTLLKYPGY